MTPPKCQGCGKPLAGKRKGATCHDSTCRSRKSRRLKAQSATRHQPRCTQRKHVVENDGHACDCGAVFLWPTVAKNARVVTLLRVR